MVTGFCHVCSRPEDVNTFRFSIRFVDRGTGDARGVRQGAQDLFRRFCSLACLRAYVHGAFPAFVDVLYAGGRTPVINVEDVQK